MFEPSRGQIIPIMLGVGVAKQVGDVFNRSLYDIHIRLSGVPMLEADVSGSDESQNVLNAKTVMSTQVECLYEAEPRGRLEQLLSTTQHNGFPVCTSDATGGTRLFAGIISRERIKQVRARPARSGGTRQQPRAAGAPRFRRARRVFCSPLT